MPAAIQSLYATGALAMKIDGTADQPAVQHMGVQQGCPRSPTLFGIFIDGLHDYLQAWCHDPLVALSIERYYKQFHFGLEKTVSLLL